MNDVILALDGIKNNKTKNSDTDSIGIHSNEYEFLKTRGLIGKDLYQSKNNYGKGGSIYGLFLASKTTYDSVIDKSCILSQKKLSEVMIKR